MEKCRSDGSPCEQSHELAGLGAAWGFNDAKWPDQDQTTTPPSALAPSTGPASPDSPLKFEVWTHTPAPGQTLRPRPRLTGL